MKLKGLSAAFSCCMFNCCTTSKSSRALKNSRCFFHTVPKVFLWVSSLSIYCQAQPNHILILCLIFSFCGSPSNIPVFLNFLAPLHFSVKKADKHKNKIKFLLCIKQHQATNLGHRFWQPVILQSSSLASKPTI